jgi:hypothetical protein
VLDALLRECFLKRRPKESTEIRVSQIGRRTLGTIESTCRSPTYNLIDHTEAEKQILRSYLHLQIGFQVQRKREEKRKDCILIAGAACMLKHLLFCLATNLASLFTIPFFVKALAKIKIAIQDAALLQRLRQRRLRAWQNSCQLRSTIYRVVSQQSQTRGWSGL